MTVHVPDKEFTKYFKQAMATPLPDLVVRQPKLRVSGFPFCGLRAAWQKMTNYVEEDGNSHKDYYCDVGTSAHSVFV